MICRRIDLLKKKKEFVIIFMRKILIIFNAVFDNSHDFDMAETDEVYDKSR